MDVEVRNLSKRYGALAALDGVSFSIPSGGRVALVGPNGAGKSTLLRALMGMIECAGEVRIGGLSPFRDRVALAARLAYVPQQAPRLAATVAEVTAAVARLRGIDAAAVARVAARLGLDTAAVAAKPFRDLSGGMKQKLLLALAFAAEASIYVLDEPTASLDATARERFFELLGTLPGAPTLILCSHRADELRRVAGRVIALEDGRVAHDGDAAGSLEAPAPREAPGGEPPNIIHPDPETAARLAAGRAAAERERARRGGVARGGFPAAALLAFLLGGASGCGAAPDGPVEPVWDKTPCARCAMLVGERPYAAQLRTADGRVLDYDDPGCLFADEVERPNEARARWFHHVREPRWVGGDAVAFVTATPSPMGFGLGAVDAGTPGAISLEEARARCRAGARPGSSEGRGAPSPAEGAAGRAREGSHAAPDAPPASFPRGEECCHAPAS